MTPSPTTIALDQIRIASPCSERWEDMSGDERTRHCDKCNLKVHNLAAMSRAEAEALFQDAAGRRVCAMFYRRADGTVLTRDCPVGLAKVRASVRRTAARIAAALGLASVGTVAGMTQDATLTGRLREWQPFTAVAKWLVPVVPPMAPGVPRGGMPMRLLGDVCIPPPPAANNPPAPAPANPANGAT